MEVKFKKSSFSIVAYRFGIVQPMYLTGEMLGEKHTLPKERDAPTGVGIDDRFHPAAQLPGGSALSKIPPQRGRHGADWFHGIPCSVLQIEQTAMSSTTRKTRSHQIWHSVDLRDSDPNFRYAPGMSLRGNEQPSYFPGGLVHNSVSNMTMKFTSCYMKELWLCQRAWPLARFIAVFHIAKGVSIR